MAINVPKAVLRRSILIDRAQNVKNVLGQGMAEYEGKVCMNNGVVAYVVNGDYFLSPGGYEVFKALVDAGFKDYTFMVIASDDHGVRGPRGHEATWQKLRANRPA
jgi:hypothetical protein